MLQNKPKGIGMNNLPGKQLKLMIWKSILLIREVAQRKPNPSALKSWYGWHTSSGLGYRKKNKCKEE